jgi:hypothetical protein
MKQAGRTRLAAIGKLLVEDIEWAAQKSILEPIFTHGRHNFPLQPVAGNSAVLLEISIYDTMNFPT